MQYTTVLRTTAKEVPLARLHTFRDRLGLDNGMALPLQSLRPTLLAHSEAFADYFYSYFIKIDKTAAILNHESRPQQLRRNWKSWYASLFSGEVDDPFLTAVWKSGVAHVTANIDQRYINLGYGLARSFCTDIIAKEIPAAEQLPALMALNALLDCCILVATDAYVEATTKCDREVVDGIAHHIRNPISIIGGNAMRLKRLSDSASDMHATLDTILQEAKRLETLAADLAEYMDIFRREPHLHIATVRDLLQDAHSRVGTVPDGFRMEIETAGADVQVFVDTHEITIAMCRLLRDALHMQQDTPAPYLTLHCAPSEDVPGHVDIVFERGGPAPHAESVNELFTPFVSLLPDGSGFDLPIARLAAVRSLGRMVLTPLESQGLRMTLTLPQPARGVIT